MKSNGKDFLDDDWASNFVNITEETKRIKIQELIDYEQQEREELFWMIDENTIDNIFEWNLNIDQKIDEEAKTNLNRSIPSHLFDSLFEVEWFKRRSRSWYTEMQFTTLKDLFQRFPGHHSKIRRYLKILNSSFYRLINQNSYEEFWWRRMKALEKRKTDLTQEEQIYAKKLFKPPAKAWTINEL